MHSAFIHGERREFIYTLPEAALWIVDMAKDLRDSFSRYKSKAHIYKDLLQPLRGLWKIVVAVLSLGLMPVIALVKAVFEAPVRLLKMDVEGSLKVLAQALYLLLAAPVVALASFLRGMTQVLSTPLTWFLRIPLRGLWTLVGGWIPMENNSGVQRLVTQGEGILARNGENAASEFRGVMSALILKTLKARKNGQPEKPLPEHFENFNRLEGSKFSFQQQNRDNFKIDSKTSVSVNQSIQLTVPNANRDSQLSGDDIVKNYQSLLDESVINDEGLRVLYSAAKEQLIRFLNVRHSPTQNKVLTHEGQVYSANVAVSFYAYKPLSALTLSRGLSELEMETALLEGQAQSKPLSFSFIERPQLDVTTFIRETTADRAIEVEDLGKAQAYLNLYKP